ncbi:MAG TPA: M48 family metalloprotease, partial [Steroidobacteraceae bacterium]
MSSPATDPEIAVVQWTPQERESFFAAIERHRRAARRVNLVARTCAVVMAVAVAVLMAPLYYAIIGLALDVLNLVVPMPDLLGTVMNAIDQAVDQPETISVGRWVFLLSMAALPGVVVMFLAVHALDRVMREAMTSDAGNYAAREPNPAVLAEQRFANVVSEMAIAANFPQPRVLIIDAEPASAAAFGESDQRATVAVSTGLLAQLNRAEMQGVAAHLVGSIANGDMLIGARVATTLGLFGLISRLGDSFANRDAFWRFMKVLRAAMRRGSSVE